MKIEPTNLKDEEAFPRFLDCPNELEIPYPRDHYRELEGGSYVPIRHWCFLGEITRYSVVMSRLCLGVKDRTGKTITVAFYLNPHASGEVPDFPVHRNIPKALTKTGNTIAILYPDQHEFIDGSIGFRIENADRVQFFPCTLERLLALGDRILTSTSQSKSVRTCYECNTTADKRCSGCDVTWYCGEACQASDWSGHKKYCKLLNQVARLMKQDWEHFHEYYTFPLQKKTRVSVTPK